MPVFKKRTRMVSFRVSPDEYEQLLATSMAQGARSVSDFARVVTLQRRGDKDGRDWEVAQAELKQLNGRVNELDSELKRLTRRAVGVGAD
jgi:hypothetical protein